MATERASPILDRWTIPIGWRPERAGGGSAAAPFFVAARNPAARLRRSGVGARIVHENEPKKTMIEIRFDHLIRYDVIKYYFMIVECARYFAITVHSISEISNGINE